MSLQIFSLLSYVGAFALVSCTSMPEYLTWRELQTLDVESHPGCKCARSSGLQGLVRKLGGELCLPLDAQEVEGLSNVSNSLCYDHDYGTGECRMWDVGRGACATSNPEPWCFHFWCWVDRDDCNSGDVHVSYFFENAIRGIGGSAPHFSYMTCGVPSEGNPYFNLWIPSHIIAACVIAGLGVPLVAFLGMRYTCYYVPALSALMLPWLLLWITVTVDKVILWMSLDTRIPKFPGRPTTAAVMEAIALLFLIICVFRLLNVIDTALRARQYQRHKEQGDSRSIQILESMLLYKELSQAGWMDCLTDFWRPVCAVAKVALGLTWVLFVLKFSMLSELISGGLIGTFFLLGLGALFSCKDDVFACVQLAIERPFRLADLISLHTCSNHLGVMNAVCVGFVERLGLLHIHIRNLDMRLQVVPTREFAKGTIKNWSARQYKASHWVLVLSMRSPPERIQAFQDGAKKILLSHPSCKGDGYIKVCVKGLADGGFECEIICFTKPKSDHHAFKLEYGMALSKLATRLGLDFVWAGISRESVDHVEAKAFQYSGGMPADAQPGIEDLLFHGRHTRGYLVSKLKKVREVGLSKRFEEGITEARLAFDLVFEVSLDHPIVVGDKELLWTEAHPQVKGNLAVLVDSGALQAILPKASVFGASSHDLFVVATVARRSCKPAQAAVAIDGSGSASKLEGLEHLQNLHRAGDEVLAICTSQPRSYNKDGHISWGETLHLGEVPLDRPTGPETTCSTTWLQLVVGRAHGSGPVELLGASEQPLLDLVQSGWEDQRVQVSMDKGCRTECLRV